MKNSAQSQVILVDDDFLDKLDGSKKHADFKPEQKSPACIYYSSGTTGNPKKRCFFHTKTCYLTFHQFVEVLNLIRKKRI